MDRSRYVQYREYANLFLSRDHETFVNGIFQGKLSYDPFPALISEKRN